MSPIMIIAIAAAVVVALGGYYLWQRRASEKLQERYGPEYHRAVGELGDRRHAEAELRKREERVEHFEIHALTLSQRDGYLADWRVVQTRFVDDPRNAVNEAD